MADFSKILNVNICSFGHLILMLSLHYLVKCRSCSLAVDNNEFILGNANLGSEIIDRIATNMTDN